ncbi:MAG: hypothetical protein E7160_00025 [Firmicutes bacterium]|nr:hypothetical protein [Bacillota bacterium]
MNIFKIKTKTKRLGTLLPVGIALYLMFMIWGMANELFEKLVPTHMQYILLPTSVFLVSIMTIMEGIYKAGPLIFNCKDDQLLFSLPIKKRTILFIRILKFYIFELIFNSMFIIPFMVAYIRWADSINITYLITSITMLFILPIIPIIISSIISMIITSLSSRFKYKNLVQIIISMTFLVGILYISYNTENLLKYLIKHADSLNDLITKIYYPAGVYAELITNFNIKTLLLFIIINICIFIVSIYILSKFYFKVNSRLKKVIISKKININNLVIKKKSKTISLIRKEISTFFKTPVFIINTGFALLLFLVATVMVSLRFDITIELITKTKELGLDKKVITDNLSIFIFLLVSVTSYMTSITSSVISLEGKNINILKSLPINTKTILISKIYSALVLTTPILILGDIILFIKLRPTIIESLLLIILSILIPLVSHLIGIIINLKYPKLDFENSAEVVKQSTSSFVSVILGMVLLMITCTITIKLIGNIESLTFLLIATIMYIVIDIILYIYLINKSVKDFNKLSI